MDYIDLMLIRAPKSTVKDVSEEDGRHQTWSVMEEFVKNGGLKHLGVSNFEVDHLDEVQGYSQVHIECNQVEISPSFRNQEVIDHCRKKNIHLVAYSPLGSHTSKDLLKDTKLIDIANRL